MSAGLDVQDAGDSEIRRWFPDRSRPRAQHVGAVVEVAAETSSRVRAAAQRARVPLVLSGDCTVGLGTVAGLRDNRSMLDWMGMAHALGFEGTEERLRTFGPVVPLLKPEE